MYTLFSSGSAFLRLARLTAIAASTSLAVFPGSMSQAEFNGFAPGNLVLSRSVYAGSASTVVVGQPLPPVCGSKATCGAVAIHDGSYPGVWQNDTVDGSFGIASPIFLDEITTDGALISTYAVPTDRIVTSFSSKSELALNLSQDGKYITFMGYDAPVNQIDVSNSNTPGVIDPTNPVGSAYYRLVAQLNAAGNLTTTETNAYSGNNGRAAVLASNGFYYSSGNAGNGNNPQPIGVVDGAGVQIITPGTTPGFPVRAGTFSVTQEGYAADKIGKDDNYRGLTLFDNTLYVTKGSGGNGINTVYQVGTAGTLPTPANNSESVTNTILPGFPTILAKSKSGVMFPFGIWFANANTLYVADEGDGTATDGNAGLQKWVLANGTWMHAYTLQKGLNLGQQYSVTNYPANLAPAPAGLRNITGRVNANGTATVWAITSTVSNSGDQGADPNQLVEITDNLANTTPSAVSSEAFQVLRTAHYGEVLRGISFTQGTVAPPTPGSMIVSASALLFSRATHSYNGTVTLTNNGSTAASGPYFVGLKSLTSGVTLLNGTVRNGLPAVQLTGAGSSLQPGQSASVSVSFSDPSNARITYTPVVEQ